MTLPHLPYNHLQRTLPMMRKYVLALLVFVCSSRMATAECEYDTRSSWCCAPTSWCDFFEYLLYEFLVGIFMHMCILHVLVFVPMLKKKMEEYKTQGLALQGEVLDSFSRQGNDASAPVKVYEYYALVEFSHGSQTTRKWVLIGKKLYEEIQRGKQTITVYSLPGYPKSATIGDPAVVGGDSTFEKFLSAAIVIIAIPVQLWLFTEYAQHYNTLQGAIPGLAAMIVFQLFVAWFINWGVKSFFIKPKFDSWLMFSEAQQAKESSLFGMHNRANEKTPLISL